MGFLLTSFSQEISPVCSLLCQAVTSSEHQVSVVTPECQKDWTTPWSFCSGWSLHQPGFTWCPQQQLWGTAGTKLELIHPFLHPSASPGTRDCSSTAWAEELAVSHRSRWVPHAARALSAHTAFTAGSPQSRAWENSQFSPIPSPVLW